MNETPIEIVTRYAQGLPFPMKREAAAQALEARGAPADAVQVVREMRQERVTGPHQIQMALRRHPYPWVQRPSSAGQSSYGEQ